jgi:hypothetical protein
MTANITAPAPAMVVAGIAIPAILPRQEASALIKALIGNESTIVALALPGARAEAALAVSLGIALQSAIFGDDSAFRRIDARARATGKVTKAGKIAGKLGSLMDAFGQARDFGKAYRDLSSSDVDLTRMLESPLCPSLPAPKVAPAVSAAAEPAEPAEPAAPAAPAARESVLSVRRENRAPTEQQQRDRAAARIRALRAALKEARTTAAPKARAPKKTAAVA